MTALMTDREADELLDAFEDAVRDRTEDSMTWRHRVDGPRDEAREALRVALLSTSAAVRGMREALEGVVLAMEIQEGRQSGELHLPAHAFIDTWKRALSNARAVLSGIETEQDQARSPSALSAPISTDTKGTTNA